MTMKKFLATLLTTAMIISAVGCGNKNNVTTETQKADTVTTVVYTAPKEATLGATLLDVFTTQMEADKDTSAQDMASTLITNEAILFSGDTVPMEEGFLPGFKEDITGFEEAIVFMPIIGSIPFVGYIFDLADDADVEAFVTNLQEKANMRWNVCTEAEQMVVASCGDKVFFVMCPNSLED